MENNGINNAQGLSLARAAEETTNSTQADQSAAAENAFARIFFSLVQRIMNEANSNSNSGA